MPQNYTPEFKKKIVRLHLEEGRTYKSITAEYGVSKASISKWCREFSEECQTSPETKEEYDSMKEMLKLRKENEELRPFCGIGNKVPCAFEAGQLFLFPKIPYKNKAALPYQCDSGKAALFPAI